MNNAMQQNEVEVFKTSIVHEEDSIRMIKLLQKKYPLYKANFDLEDCDKILRIEGLKVEVQQIINLLKSTGFQCEVLV